MRFVCVVDDTPPETPRLLAEACAARHVPFELVEASTFDYDETQRLAPGDLLFRPAASDAARTVELFLYAPGVATFYAGVDGIYVDLRLERLVLGRRGVPVPQTIYCSTSDKARLDSYVSRLGGYPVVANLGGQGGRGTLRFDSSAAFYAGMDFCVDHGLIPALSAFVPDAVHWRVVVVAGRAVAAYPNPVKPNDFRSAPSADPSEYTSEVEPSLATLACAATAAADVEMAGVDILRAPGRTDVVLEANFPCYFPKAQLMAGIDVAGAIVDGLVAKAVRENASRKVR